MKMKTSCKKTRESEKCGKLKRCMSRYTINVKQLHIMIKIQLPLMKYNTKTCNIYLQMFGKIIHSLYT